MCKSADWNKYKTLAIRALWRTQARFVLCKIRQKQYIIRRTSTTVVIADRFTTALIDFMKWIFEVNYEHIKLFPLGGVREAGRTCMVVNESIFNGSGQSSQRRACQGLTLLSQTSPLRRNVTASGFSPLMACWMLWVLYLLEVIEAPVFGTWNSTIELPLL